MHRPRNWASFASALNADSVSMIIARICLQIKFILGSFAGHPFEPWGISRNMNFLEIQQDSVCDQQFYVELCSKKRTGFWRRSYQEMKQSMILRMCLQFLCFLMWLLSLGVWYQSSWCLTLGIPKYQNTSSFFSTANIFAECLQRNRRIIVHNSSNLVPLTFSHIALFFHYLLFKISWGILQNPKLFICHSYSRARYWVT